MRGGDEGLLWSRDITIVSAGEKIRGRISILKESMIIEERYERVLEDPKWRNRIITDLPSPDDIRIIRKGFFNKMLTIKWKDNEYELITEEPQKVLEEIRTVLNIASNLKSSRNGSILALVGKTGSSVLN